LRKNHSFIETPNVKPQKFLEKNANVESGKTERFNFKSEFLENERTVSIYSPPKFDASKKYPLLILLDEEIYLDEINVPTILDNLLAENLIPPMISVFVGNSAGMRRNELGGNLQFAEFVNGELLDWIRKSYKLSENPNESIIGGASFGGLSAILTGLSYPETFGKILSQSGSFWRNWDSVTAKLFERDFPRQKIYLDAGIYEIEQKNDTNILETNRNLRDILQAKKIAVSYQEFKGGHGAVNWRGTLSDGLIFLTKDLLKKQTLVGNPNLF
jgi:enterochelin esterase-like enzyme